MKKICRKCNVEKLLSEYNKMKSSKDGKYYYCKECARVIYHENKHKYKEKKSKYTKQYDIDNAEARVVYMSKYVKINKQDIFTRNRGYYDDKKHLPCVYLRENENYIGVTENLYHRSAWYKSVGKDFDLKPLLYLKNRLDSDIIEAIIQKDYSYNGWNVKRGGKMYKMAENKHHRLARLVVKRIS